MSVDVSVIIASYNVERYIARAIKSALTQDNVTVEIIVIDDGSTDNTGAIVASFQDERIKYIKKAKNAGPGAARNAGMDMASGKWLAVLDGDDAFAPGRLARCLARARENQSDIIIDNITVYKEADGLIYPMFSPVRFSRMKRLELAAFIAGEGSFFDKFGFGYLKPIISADFRSRHQLSYMTDIHIGEDYLFMAYMLAKGALCTVEPTAGYVYTIRAGSLSHRLRPEDVRRIAKGDKKFMERHNFCSAVLKAQKKRDFHIKEADAFIRLADAIKQKDFSAGYRALRMCPVAARHLWRPVWARLARRAHIPRRRA